MYDIESLAYRNNTLFTDQYSHSLTQFVFENPTRHAFSPCPISRFEIKNGDIFNERDLPFFLPETVVTIMCKKGFVVKGLNNSTVQQIRCERDVAVKPCVPTKERKLKWNNSKTTGAVSFLLTINCCVLFAVIFVVTSLSLVLLKALKKVDQLQQTLLNSNQTMRTSKEQLSMDTTSEPMAIDGLGSN